MSGLVDLDKQIFLGLNQLHTSWLDPAMMWISGNLIWVPLYAFLLFQLGKLPRTQLIMALLCLVVGITLSDQLTSGILKPLIGRPRPSWDPVISSLVHTVDGYRGGHFGFPSSHAANTFCTATLITCVLRVQWVYGLFLWAALVSYSRIYLGVHYPGDILVGAIIGCLCGFLSFRLYKAVCGRLSTHRHA